MGIMGYHLMLERKFQEEGSSMNHTAVVDWKFTIALGVAAASIIFSSKMTAADAKEVSIHMIDACKEYAIALSGDC